MFVESHFNNSKPIEQPTKNASFVNGVLIREIECLLIMFLVKTSEMPFGTELIEKPYAIRNSQVTYSVVFCV